MPRSRFRFQSEPILLRSHAPRASLALRDRGGVRIRTAAHRVLALVALLCFTMATIESAVAEEPNPAATAPSLVTPPPSVPPAAPGVDTSTAGAEPSPPSLLTRWWFWTAVGAVVAATVGVAVLSSRGSAVPATDLGNQELGR